LARVKNKKIRCGIPTVGRQKAKNFRNIECGVLYPKIEVYPRNGPAFQNCLRLPKNE
jgi:hypothetical protein